MKRLATPARWLAASAVLAAAWALTAPFLVSPVIERAYRGQSHPLLNGIITGQELHGVEHFLGLGTYWIWIGTVLILASGTALYLAGTCHLGDRVPLLTRLVDVDTLTAGQSIRFALTAVALAGVTGLIASVGGVQGYQALSDAVIPERGGIQQATFGLLAMGTLLALLAALRHPNSRGSFLLMAFLMAVYTGRELDRPVIVRLGRTEHWMPFLGGSSHFLSKIAFVLLIVAFGLAIILLIQRLSIFRALARREAFAIYGCVWSVMLAGSQVIDRTPIGAEDTYRAFEEPLEMFASAVCVLCIYTLANREAARDRWIARGSKSEEPRPYDPTSGESAAA